MNPVPQQPVTSPPPAPLRADTLSDSVVLVLALVAVQRLVGFGRSVLMCRWLEPAELGQWEMAFTFLTLAAPLAVLGLPGSFGRYVEYFSCRGQLRTYLKRTAFASTVLACLAVVAAWLLRPWLAVAVFGTGEFTQLAGVLAGALAAVIAYNFLAALFCGLRMYRAVFKLQFCHALIFALLSVGLLAGGRSDAASVVAAYGGACLVCGAGAIWFLRRAWHSLPVPSGPPSGRFWTKLLPFALWVWTTNLLVNLFEVADRYVIVHCGGQHAAEALAQVGQYHTSRVIPMLLVAVAGALASMLTPHLSLDWEAGRRDAVSRRLNLGLKLLGISFLAASVVVLSAARLFFGTALAGRFGAGEALFPWTLAYCCWWGLMLLAQKYLLCAERAWLASVAMFIGLAVNVGLAVFLLPRFGLPGVVLATAVANALGLALIYVFCGRSGMQLDPGTMLVSGAPLALCAGLPSAASALAAVALLAVCGSLVLSGDEKRQVVSIIRNFRNRFASALSRAVGRSKPELVETATIS